MDDHLEGSLEPFCRLTHSIIQARRCRRETMRSRSFVRVSSRALASCSDVQREGDTHGKQALRRKQAQGGLLSRARQGNSLQAARRSKQKTLSNSKDAACFINKHQGYAEQANGIMLHTQDPKQDYFLAAAAWSSIDMAIA